MSEDSTRPVRAAAVTAIVIAATYVFRAAATPYLLDSTELVATTFALGVSHPPGHPAFHMLGVGWLALPLGTAAFRTHLFVALSSALCLSLLPIVAHRLGWLRTRAHAAFASLVAIALAFTPAFAQQSIRAEVYALNALVAATATALLVRPERDARIAAVVGAAVALGVGLLNHHYLTVFTFPAFAFAVAAGVIGWRERIRHVVAGTVAGATMLLGYAYLLARGAARPSASWGWPDSAEDVWWTLTAKAFQKTAGRAAEMDVASGLVNLIGVLGESLTLPGFLLAAAGLVAVALRQRRVGVFLLLATVFNLATQVVFDFDPMNPDALGYFMPAYWWLGLGLVYLVTHITLPGNLTRLTGPLQLLLGVILLVGISVSARYGPRTVSLAHYWDSELLRDEALNGLAPDSVWITAYYETGFDTWYAQAVEDRRPDVTHIHQSFLTYPFYREMLAARGEEVAALVGAEDGEPLLSLDGLLARAERAEVRIEAEQLVTPELARHAIPTRLYLQLLPEALPTGRFPPSLAREALENAAAVRARFGDPIETQTGRNLLWAYYNLAGQMCAAERWLTCRAILGEALELSPNDPDLLGFAAEIDRRLQR